MSNRPTTSIPTTPDEDLLLAMARRAYPGFDVATDLDGHSVGMNEHDRSKALATMRGVYAVVLGQADAAREEAEYSSMPAEDGAWYHSDWLQSLSLDSLNALLAHFHDIAPSHWHVASESSAGPGFPVVMKNERIGPMLAERVDEEGQTGFLPYVAGLEADGIRWHIEDGKLDRWKVAKIPGSARGWVELFAPGSADARDRSAEVAPLFAKLKDAVACKASDDVVIAAMDEMFSKLKRS